MIPQNEALLVKVSFFRKDSLEVIRGQKTEIGQIPNFIKSMENIRQNKALKVNFWKLVSSSLMVMKGQESQKKGQISDNRNFY